jgi:hypothetical protein
LVDNDLLQGADVLFSEGLPGVDHQASYSFAWSGDIPYETTIQIVRDFVRAESIYEVEKKFDAMEIYGSVP